MSTFSRRVVLIVLGAISVAVAYNMKTPSAVGVPAPAANEAQAAAAGQETAVLAGGCFWGIQAVYQHVKGVISATSGYSGGSAKNPDYEMVSTGDTGHAESVQIVYDPSQITYGQLLQIFFSVAHDPTELNRQGPDEGTQYRSAVFYANDQQKQTAEAYIAQLETAKVYRHKIVTQVVPLKAFYPAEAYHQNYATLHPESPYIMFNDAPKVSHLKKEFPELYVSKPTLVAAGGR